MQPSPFNPTARERLQTLFEAGAAQASEALSRWLGQAATLRTAEVEELELSQVSEILGSPETLVAACSMELTGAITGHLLLVFEDRSGLALADLLLRQADGTACSWGELERSAATETANIVGCAYLNALASLLPRSSPDAEATIHPSPPAFRHEFAGSLLEFVLMEQTLSLDRLLLMKTRFEAQARQLDWWLVLVPSSDALGWLADALSGPLPSETSKGESSAGTEVR